MMDEKTIEAIINFANTQIQITKLVNRNFRLSESLMKSEKRTTVNLLKTYGITNKKEIERVSAIIIDSLS